MVMKGAQKYGNQGSEKMVWNESKLGWRSRFGSLPREVIAKVLQGDKMLSEEAEMLWQDLGESHHLGAGERSGMGAGTRVGVEGEQSPPTIAVRRDFMEMRSF